MKISQSHLFRIVVFCLILLSGKETEKFLDAELLTPLGWKFHSKAGLQTFFIFETGCIQVDGDQSHCPQGPTEYVVTHWDPEHIPLRPPPHVACLHSQKSPPLRFHAWKKLIRCFKNPEFAILAEGTEDWDSNMESRIIYFRRDRVLLLGDAPVKKILSHRKLFQRLHLDWIVLPQQGKNGSLNQEVFKHLRPRRGFLVNSKDRKGKSRLHKKTKALFSKRALLIDSSDWGNLVFPRSSD